MIIKQKLAGNIDFDYKWYDIYNCDDHDIRLLKDDFDLTSEIISYITDLHERPHFDHDYITNSDLLVYDVPVWPTADADHFTTLPIKFLMVDHTLSSAPAIAKKVTEMVGMVVELNKKDTLVENPEHIRFVNLTPEQLNEKVKEDSRWGRIICRCEKVTEAEIVTAIHSPLPAKSVDAVKRRTRAGMGRCQGGFCAPRVIDIIARELNIPVTAVKKDNGDSEIAIGKLKEVEYEI